MVLRSAKFKFMCLFFFISELVTASTYSTHLVLTNNQTGKKKNKKSNISTWIKVIVFNPRGQAWFNLPQHWESLSPNICYYFWGKLQDLLKVARLSSSCDDSQQCQKTFDCTLHLCAAPGLSSHQRGRTMLRRWNTHTYKHANTNTLSNGSHHSQAVSTPHAGYAPWHKDISYTFPPAWV